MPSEGQFPIEFLFENELASPAEINKGMGAIEADLAARHERESGSWKEARELFDPVREGIFDAVGRPDSLVAALESLRSSAKSFDKGDAPPVAKEEQRLFLGSLGATLTEPFNYEWTWATSESLQIGPDPIAHATNGSMAFLMISGDNPGSGSAACAIGTYFRPVLDAPLHIWSSPSYWRNWSTHSLWSPAHSEGWIGLYVGRYRLDGSFEATALDQRATLWNDTSGWLDDRPNRIGTSTAYPLSARFAVDRGHQYAIWVWCGGTIWADGWHTFSGSSAAASMHVALPSISWELG